MKKLLVFLLFVSPVFGVVLPDKKLTPGKANPVLTRNVICAQGFRTGPYRHVTESMKRKVFEEYHIDYSSHSLYEIDHLIALTDGGSNDLLNLWSQPYEPRPAAHEKDELEVWLHKRICAGDIGLKEAQDILSNNWYEGYQQMKIEKGEK